MWKKRTPPTPLKYGEQIGQALNGSKDQNSQGLKDQQLWSLYENFHVFLESVNILGKRMSETQETFSFDVPFFLFFFFFKFFNSFF